jgi:hypothetical protein
VKTISLKKVAVVAVASLALTSLSVAVATAAEGDFTVTGAYNTTSATQVVGGTVTLTFAGAVPASGTANTYTFTSSGVGSIGSAAATALTGSASEAAVYLVGTTTNATFPNSGLDYKTSVDANEAAQTFTITLASAVAGTQTITAVKKDANGTPTKTYTQSVTWTTAANTGINAAKSTIYVATDDGDCSDQGASKAADSVIAAAESISRTPVNTAVDVCVIARDANDNLLTIASGTVTGSFGRSDTSAASETGEYRFDLDAASAVLSGTETITGVIIDSFGNAAVLTTTLSVYGSLKKIEISALRGSAYASSDQTDPANDYAGAVAAAATSKDIIVGMKATDANSAVIDLAVSANSTATSAWTLDSDKVAGVPADRTSQTLGSSVQDQSVSGELSSTKWGTNAAYIECGTLPEKLTITAWGKDSDGNWLKSNSLDVYCAGDASTVTVTPSATSVATGASGTVNVSVKDANGYPVADGTSVTLAANNGAVVAPSSKTTVNGAFATAANLIVGSDAASTTVSAIAGGKTGTATVTVTGGSSNASLLTQIDALNAKIVALNALIAKIMKKLGVK